MTPVALVRDPSRGGAGQQEADQRGAPPVAVRRARPADVPGVVALVAEWAAEGLVLARTPAQVAAALDSYVVACDARGRVLACAALREYSPSLAEVVSVAVAAAAHGRGLGRRVVRAAEALAAARGHSAVFAHTLQLDFFAALGYEPCDRGLYPEKRARAHTACVRRALAPAAGWGHAPLAAAA